MKKYVVLFALLTHSYVMLACDMCSGYLGINPNYNKNIISMRYRMSQYEGVHSHSNVAHLHSDGTEHFHFMPHEELVMKERYQTLELWSRWYLKPKLQLFISLPFAYNTEVINGVQLGEVYGLRDATILLRYQVYNSQPEEDAVFQQRVLLGGGIKLPTGKYSQTNYNPTFMPGTGSFDAMFSGSYLMKLKKLSWSNDLVYTYNTTNKYDYRFANRFNFTSHLYYSFSKDKMAVMPFIGAYGELAGADDWDGETQLNTGGKAIFGSAGVELYWKRISGNITWQLPFSEQLNGEQGNNQFRIICGISLVI